MVNKKTQKAKIIEWLRSNGGLTVRQAMLDLNINSAPKRIEELKRDGYDIRTNMIKCSDGTRYGIYTLHE